MEPQRADVAIVGGGPAGCSAALTAAELGFSVILVEAAAIGGQLRRIPHLKNLPGSDCTGEALAQILVDQLASTTVRVQVRVVSALGRSSTGWRLFCENEDIEAPCVVLATGARPITVAEHPAIEVRATGFRDTSLDDISIAEFRGRRWAIIGCDRPLISRLESEPLEEAWHSATLFALTEKAYVLRDYRGFLPKTVECSRVVVTGSPGTFVVTHDGAVSAKADTSYEGIMNCLGKRPVSELLEGFVSLDAEGYPAQPCPHVESDGAALFWVGDVAHRAFQRVSVAIGEGASAALRWFYEQQRLYGFGGRRV